VPSVDANLNQWDQNYQWQDGGDEWSENWGSPSAQWYACIYPRVHRFLPAPTILEIAPGYGRWTEFLLPHCDALIGVELSPTCTAACAEKFADHPEASFYTNDGSSLPMVEDGSVDFAFSFDSLVHVETDALAGYLKELARVLSPSGVAFLHHSNFGAYQRSSRLLAPFKDTVDHLPTTARNAIIRVGAYRGDSLWRDGGVSASSFASLSRAAGLECCGQELVNWAGGGVLTDCFSVVARPGSRWDRPNRVIKNWLFYTESRVIRRSAVIYEALPPSSI